MGREILEAALRKVLNSHEGQKVIAWLLKSSGAAWGQSYSHDPLRMAWQEGRRGLGLELKDLIKNLDPAAAKKINNLIWEMEYGRDHGIEQPEQ